MILNQDDGIRNVGFYFLGFLQQRFKNVLII